MTGRIRITTAIMIMIAGRIIAGILTTTGRIATEIRIMIGQVMAEIHTIAGQTTIETVIATAIIISPITIVTMTVIPAIHTTTVRTLTTTEIGIITGMMIGNLTIETPLTTDITTARTMIACSRIGTCVRTIAAMTSVIRIINPTTAITAI